MDLLAKERKMTVLKLMEAIPMKTVKADSKITTIGLVDGYTPPWTKRLLPKVQ